MAVQPPWIGPLLLLFTAREALPTHLAQSPSFFLSSKSGFSPVTIPLGPRFRATAPVSRRRPVRQIRGRCSPEGRPEKSQEKNCEDPGPEKEMMVHKVGDVLEGRKYNYTIVRVLPPSIDGTDMYEAAYATDLGAQIVTIRALRLSKLRTWGQLDQLEEEATSMMTPSGKLRSARMVEKFEVTRGEDTKWYLIQEPIANIDQLPLESEQAKSQPKRAMKAVGITRGRMTIISRGGGLFARIEPQGMERGIGTKTAFAVAWNVFVFVWTRGSLMAGGPLFAAFSLPFWASGLRMGRETVRSIYRSLVTTEIEVIDGYLKLSKSLSLPQRKRRRIRRNEEGGVTCRDVTMIWRDGTLLLWYNESPLLLGTDGYYRVLPDDTISERSPESPSISSDLH
ncbi:hypothetical protein AAMO2058_000239800 [Amorphochlora amoebiformis]